MPNIILETIASLNEINPLTSRLIQITRDGKITEAIDALNLWVEKTASDHNLNIDLLNEEKVKLR